MKNQQVYKVILIFLVISVVLVISMRKGSGTKTRISLTLDKELVDTLNKLCESQFMKVSPFVEFLIKKGLEDRKKSK